MNILITGVTGFIGGFLENFFSGFGHNVTGVVRGEHTGKQSHRIHVDRLIDRDVVRDLGEIDVIIHAAAQSPYNCRRVSQYIDGNVLLTRQIVEFAAWANVKSIIYLSSISVYGDINVPVVDENTDIINPRIYGVTKYLGEEILREAAADTDAAILALRLPGVLGKGAHSPWLAKATDSIRKGENIDVYNADALFNNVLYLDDLSAFIQSLLPLKSRGFEPLTLAAGQPMTIGETVGLIRDEVNPAVRIGEKKTGKCSFIISTEKARDKYGFSPATTRKTIQKYIEENHTGDI